MSAGGESLPSGAAGAHLTAVFAALAGYAVLRSAVLPGNWHFATNVAFAALVVIAARTAGYTTADLGLERRFVGAGLRVGAVAAAAVCVVLAVAASLPAGRRWFEHDGADLATGELLVKALWTIPVGTVIVEELLFRAVVLGIAMHTFVTSRAVVISAVIFGSWHIAPIVGDGPAAVLGTVAATTVAGVGFAWLRLRSRSIVAPMLAHLATNSGALTAAWIVGRS